MSNPIGALIAAFGGGVNAYDNANQRQLVNDRADQEQQRRLALEDLAQQEALNKMGAHAGAPPAPTAPAPNDAALTSSVGITPSAAIAQLTNSGTPTPSVNSTDPLTGKPTQTNFAVPAAAPDTSDAVRALASAGAPSGSAPPPLNTAASPNFQTFNLQGTDGSAHPYYINPDDTPEAKASRLLTQREAAAQKLADAKLAQQQAQKDATNRGAFTMLQNEKYLPQGSQQIPGLDYAAMLKDYFTSKHDDAQADRQESRNAMIANGPARLAQQQREEDALDAAQAWFTRIYQDPTNKDRQTIGQMYNALSQAHPSWDYRKVMLATQKGMTLGIQQEGGEARNANTNAGLGIKDAEAKMMNTAINAGGTPAPTPAPAPATATPMTPLNISPVSQAAAAPTAAPPPAFVARARALQAQGLSKAAIAAQLQHEGFNPLTGARIQ